MSENITSLKEIVAAFGKDVRKPVEEETNLDFIVRVTQFSNNGPLTELMVIEAIRFYSDMVRQSEPRKDDGKSLISPLAWHQTASDLYREWERKYGQ